MEGNLKNLTLEFNYDELKKMGLNYLSKDCNKITIIDGLKISKDDCVNIWKTKNELETKKLSKRLGLTETSKISEKEGGKFYLIKKSPSKLTLLLDKYNIYYEFPIELKEGAVEISIRGLSTDINKFFKAMEKSRIKFKIKRAADFIETSDILSALTEKQRAALFLAIQEGYFKTPRLTDAHTLASSLGIRHTTFLQHLRRAQEKILLRVTDNAF